MAEFSQLCGLELLTAKIAKDAKKKLRATVEDGRPARHAQATARRARRPPSTFSELGFQQGFRRDFHNWKNCWCSAGSPIFGGNPGKMTIREIKCRERNWNAPKMLHPPVDELHSLDLPADNHRPFLLTIKIKGVKQTRSLTASEVFPVGAASGAQAKSLSASQDDGGKAGKGL